MKVAELLENAFKQWAQENKDRKQKERAAGKEHEKNFRVKQRQQNAEAKLAADRKLLQKIEDAISNSFPDGDPFDHFSSYLRHNDLDMSDVNRVVRKAHGVDYHRHLARMWDEVASQAIHDAKNGHVETHSAFYDVDKDGKITRAPNPWK